MTTAAPRTLVYQNLLNCRDCPLAEQRTRVVPGFGVYPSKIMFVAEAPGESEDRRGIPLIGRSGTFFKTVLRNNFGWDADQFFRTNTVLCRPPGNRNPTKGEVSACAPWLSKQIDTVDPDIIVAMGATSYKSFMPDESSPLTQIRGNVFERTVNGRKRFIIPTWHPANVLRKGPVELKQFIADIQQAKDIVDGKYKAVLDFRKHEAAWQEVLDATYSDLPLLGFDLETDSLHRHAKIIGVGVCDTPGNGLYYPFESDEESYDRVEELRYALQSPDRMKVVSNARFERHVLHSPYYNIKMQGFYDTLVEAWVLGDKPKSLKDGFHQQFGIEMIRIDVFKKMRRDDGKIGYTNKDWRGETSLDMRWAQKERREAVVEYAAQDPDASLRLHTAFYPLLEERNLTDLYTNVEIPFLEPIIKMEQNGIVYKNENLAEASEKINAALIESEARLRELVGIDWNVGSTNEVVAALYGFKPTVLTTIKTGKKKGEYTDAVKQALLVASTEHPYRLPMPPFDPAERRTPEADKITLAQYLDNPLAREVLLCRALRKMKGTYIEGLPTWVEADGKIHPTINATAAETGRVSVQDPGLQQIPARQREDVSLPIPGSEIRKAFVADQSLATPGDPWIIMAMDLSQIEMRMAAHMSGDETMIALMTDPKGDLHANSTVGVYGETYEELMERIGEYAAEKEWKNRRYLAKTIGFGVLYGLTAHGLLVRTPTLDLSIDQCAAFIDRFYDTYPRLREFHRATIEFTKKHGYAQTILGRRRYLPDIWASDKRFRGDAERAAINVPVQGSAADYFKKAILAVEPKLLELGVKSRLILQIHDEIVLEGPLSEMPIIQNEVVPMMTTVMELKVPVRSDFEVGHSWGEVTSVEKFMEGLAA